MFIIADTLRVLPWSRDTVYAHYPTYDGAERFVGGDLSGRGNKYRAAR